MGNGVYTSTLCSSSETIALHNELAYLVHPPKYLLFYCDIPPANEGETPIVDGRRLFGSLSPDIQDSCTDNKSNLLDRVRETAWREASFFACQRGDLLFLNNHLVAHGRNRFSGARRILPPWPRI